MSAGEALGSRLREARRRVRLSQTSVARFVGTTRQTIATYERGIRTPVLSHMVGLANLYRHTLDELMSTARSAVRPTRTPVFHARFNTPGNLPEQDRQELAAFEAYLAERPVTAPFSFDRAPFETVAETAHRWRKTLKAEKAIPCPVFAMLAQCGIEVRFTALEELAGALLTRSSERSAGMLINSDQPSERQRFTAAHEVGHFVLGHPTRIGGFVSYLGRRFDPIEVLADQFAADLLMPAELLSERARDLPTEGIAEQVYRLSAGFMVSYQAMTTRLVKLGALSPEQGEEAGRVRPSAVAQRLGLSKEQESHEFEVSWLPGLVKRYLPSDWHRSASPETVRLLQEAAVTEYVRRVPEGNQSDDVGAVYEKAAVWVARTYPLVAA